MLKVPAPFPQVGSYALTVDPALHVDLQRAELVRIQRHVQSADDRHEVAVAFPLRLGASGNRVVPFGDVIDATPLTKDEERELADLQRDLHGRTRPNKAKAARCEELRKRLIMSGVMRIELDKLAAVEARTQRRQGGSRGGALPSEIAA